MLQYKLYAPNNHYLRFHLRLLYQVVLSQLAISVTLLQVATAISLLHSVLSKFTSVGVFWQWLLPTVTAVVINEHCTDF